MKRKILTLLSALFLTAIAPLCAKADIHYNDLPQHKCTTYCEMVNKQMSGVTSEYLRYPVELKSTDKDGYEQYNFKFKLEEESQVSVWAEFLETMYFDWKLEVFTDATMEHLYAGTGDDISYKTTDVVYRTLGECLDPGEYYVRLTIKYNNQLVKDATQVITTTTPVTNSSSAITGPSTGYNSAGFYGRYTYKYNGDGTMTTTFIPEPSLNLQISDDGSEYTIGNKFCIAMAYVKADDLVKLTTKSINEVATVKIDATNFAQTQTALNEPYIQYKKISESHANNGTWKQLDPFDEKHSNWGTGNTVDGIMHVLRDESSKYNIKTFYIRDTGWYRFHVVQPTDSGYSDRYVDIIQYIDCTKPTTTFSKSGGYYKTNCVEIVKDEHSLNEVTLDEIPYVNGTTIDEEGKHTIRAWDSAGNKLTSSFWIDKTKPVISGVKNNKKYTKAKKYQISDNIRLKTIRIEFNGKKRKDSFDITVNKDKEKVVTKKFNWSNAVKYLGFDKDEYTFSTFKKLKPTGIGTYTITVKDKAGNKTIVKYKLKGKNNNRGITFEIKTDESEEKVIL